MSLVGGWNAAAAYPLTWLFAILPGTAAWTAGLIVTWETAGLGMFCFLRALRIGLLAGAFSGRCRSPSPVPCPRR